MKYGAIATEEELFENLATHCIPEDVFEMDVEHYASFLEKRRVMMAAKMRKYYEGL